MNYYDKIVDKYGYLSEAEVEMLENGEVTESQLWTNRERAYNSYLKNYEKIGEKYAARGQILDAKTFGTVYSDFKDAGVDTGIGLIMAKKGHYGKANVKAGLKALRDTVEKLQDKVNEGKNLTLEENQFLTKYKDYDTQRQVREDFKNVMNDTKGLIGVSQYNLLASPKEKRY
jgi:hypothetical protein